MRTATTEQPAHATAGYFYFARLPSPSAHSIQVLSMCEALEAIGFRTTLFAGQDPDQSKVNDAEILARYGVENRPALHWVRWERGWRGKARTFITTLRWAGRFDVCFTRSSLAAFACQLKRQTCHYELHSPRFSRTDRLLLRILRRSRWVQFAANSGVTAQMVSDCVGLDRSRIRIAHNGCKIPSAGSDSVALDPSLLSHFKGPGLHAVYIGSFYPGRGIDTIAELARRHADVQFIAIGGTAEKTGLPPAVTELPNLHLVDRIAHNLAGAVLQRADISLMPYRKRVTCGDGEGDYLAFCSPIKMFEYLAAGKAIISTGSPSIEEVLHDGENAIVLEAEDLEAWSNAIQRLKEDSELRAFLGRNALATAMEHRWEVRARTLLSGPEAHDDRG